jgi:hypothetical protein
MRNHCATTTVQKNPGPREVAVAWFSSATIIWFEECEQLAHEMTAAAQEHVKCVVNATPILKTLQTFMCLCRIFMFECSVLGLGVSSISASNVCCDAS